MEDRISFVHADYTQIASQLKADVVFLSPPWGGPEYAEATTFDMETMMGGLDGVELLRTSLEVAPNVAYFLPRNVDQRQVRMLSTLTLTLTTHSPLNLHPHPNQVRMLAAEAGVPLEIERNFLNRREKAVTAYYGFEEETWGGEADEDDPLFE